MYVFNQSSDHGYLLYFNSELPVFDTVTLYTYIMEHDVECIAEKCYIKKTNSLLSVSHMSLYTNVDMYLG